MARLLTFSACLLALVCTTRVASAQQASSTDTSPRAWPIVVGSLIFVPSYGLTVYWALSGDATSYGPVPEGETQGKWNFGDPALLFVPLVGPLFFQSSFCDDAREELGPSGEADDACRGGFWTLDAAVQAIGAAFIAAGFLIPVETSRDGARIVVTPHVGESAVGLSARGEW